MGRIGLIFTLMLAMGCEVYAVARPGYIGAQSTDCEPGETCVCEGTGSCDLECSGPDCGFICRGLGSCDLECEAGGCDALCEVAGSCNLSCPGGDCTLTCAGGGSCNLEDCQEGGCDID